jgi:hypothetical protein
MYASEYKGLDDQEIDEGWFQGVFMTTDCPDRCDVAQLWGQIVVRGSE